MADRQMRRRTRLLVPGLIGVAVFMAGCATEPPEDDSVTLVMADAFSSTHPVGIAGSQPFIEYVNEHGPAVGLEIDAYSAGALGSPSQIPTLLKGGVIDLGYVIPANLAEQLPLSIVSNLPALSEDTCLTSEALLPMMQPGGAIYDHELEGLGFQAIWGQNMPNMEIMTANHHVESPSDLRGLLIASNGGQTDRVLQGLGAAPVPMEASDYYEGVARNIVDGVMTAKYATVTYGLEDEIGHSTLGANLGVSSIFMSIRSEVWDDLTVEQQQVLTEAGEIAQGNVCAGFSEADEDAIATFEEEGIEFGAVPQEDRLDWDNVLGGVREEWADAAESRGIPARETLNELEARIDELEGR